MHVQVSHRCRGHVQGQSPLPQARARSGQSPLLRHVHFWVSHRCRGHVQVSHRCHGHVQGQSPLPLARARSSQSPLPWASARSGQSPLPSARAHSVSHRCLGGMCMGQSPLPWARARSSQSPLPRASARSGQSPLPWARARSGQSPLPRACARRVSHRCHGHVHRSRSSCQAGSSVPRRRRRGVNSVSAGVSRRCDACGCWAMARRRRCVAAGRRRSPGRPRR